MLRFTRTANRTALHSFHAFPAAPSAQSLHSPFSAFGRKLLWASPLEQFELLAADEASALYAVEAPLALANLATQVLLPLFFVLALPLLLLSSQPSLLPRSWLGWLAGEAPRSLGDFLRQNATLSHQGYLPLLAEFALLLLAFNLGGLLPYGFTLTAQMVVTFFFGFAFFFGLNLIALRRHGARYWGLFLPGGTPFALAFLLVLLELISYYSRVISISVRLFANMMAGHALMKILASFTYSGLAAGGFSTLASLLGLVVVFAILGLEFGVALLQVFVFLTLLGLYLRDVATTSH